MPRSAIQRGAVHQVLPLDEIPGALQRLLPHGNNL
jgi:chemotaxis response regulator CheB